MIGKTTRGLSKMTGGLSEVSVVPRNRIELLTRGFSVPPSLLMDMLSHMAALGRIAEELGRAMGGDLGPVQHHNTEVELLPARTAGLRPGRTPVVTSRNSTHSAAIRRKA
jgi:hypothetical protein